MVEEAQALVDGERETESFEADNDWECSKNVEIRDDRLNMTIPKNKQFFVDCDEMEKSRVGKWVMHYQWNHDNLMFKGLVVPKPDERQQIIMDLQN